MPQSLEESPTWFHSAQRKFWDCPKPIVCICAGWQSGKTVSLVPWLLREIQRCGPGDYGAFSATFRLLDKKLLPEMEKALGPFAEWRSAKMQFRFTHAGSRLIWGKGWSGEPTVIQLGYAENPDSLESATLKAAIWDEAGQRLVPEQSFRTVMSRLMVHRGRLGVASRPYEPGWYERLVKDGLAGSERVGVINFPSWANPLNPPETDPYWDELRAKMPLWMFLMLYEGIFTRPAGLIYDCFDYDRDTYEDRPIPKGWNIYPGVDFGGLNMAGILVAEDPHSGELLAFHEYHVGQKRETKDHVRDIRNGNALSIGAGGSHQEDGWRESFGGSFLGEGIWLDEPPVNDVEVQIQCVYEQIATHKLKFARKGCSRTIDQLETYAREVDDDGVPTEKIANKSIWHLLDALRYIITKLRPPKKLVLSSPSYTPKLGAPTPNVNQAPERRWDLTGRFARK
jgi:hypothetical protein